MEKINLISTNAVTGSKNENTTFLEDLKSLIKLGIINSNLFTAFTGFWLAVHFADSRLLLHWDSLLFTLLGSGLVIAGGCVLNNWYDVDIDPVMERTKTRPTVTGNITLQQAFVLGITLSLLGFGLLTMTTLTATIIAFVGWFTYVVLYTVWSKRRYTLNTAVGSISGAVPPLIGWTAINPEMHIVPIGLFLIMFIWQTPHFLALAMKKKDEYKKAEVPMLPAVYGFDFTKRQIIIYIACLFPLPFYLIDLGKTFVIFATVLNVIWLTIAIGGLFIKNHLKWANWIFVFSLSYMMLLFLTMITVTI